MSVSCSAQQPDAARTNSTAPVPTPSPSSENSIQWSSDPTQHVADNEPLRRAWRNFESSQKYRLAQPSDRRLSPAAVSRVNSNNPNQIIPFLTWWGSQGYRGDGKDFLVAVVVDPSRTDTNRYGLVVLAAPESEGAAYKVYWVMREADMESWLISPASGSVFMECFQRDGSNETKEIAWDRKSKRFKLI